MRTPARAADSARVIDSGVAPFTHELKARAYAESFALKETYERLGAWERSYAPKELLERMDAAGILKALVKAPLSNAWRVKSEVIEPLLSQAPDRLFGLVAADPRGIVQGVKEIREAIVEQKFVGVHSYPHWFGLHPDDRVYYPFYAASAELGVPVQIQAGIAYQKPLRNVGHPSSFEAIVIDFPELNVIATHTGYPWEREFVALAWKHDNLYLAVDSVSPARWPNDLVKFIREHGRGKVLFGSNYPIMEFSDVLAGVAALELGPDAYDDLMYKTAESLYSLSDENTPDREAPHRVRGGSQ